MFIKLTRMDGSPIWLNASFVVTVEPRKGGGSIVVPIGDGLDYDVRETPASVLAQLGDAPAPAVVPVPAPKMLAPTHEDMALGPDEAPVAEAAPAPEEAPMPPAEAEQAAPEAAQEPEAAAEKPAKKTRTTAKRTTKTRSRAKKPALDLDEEQVARLKKMAPGSIRKLTNTLATQFKAADPEATVKALEAQGHIALDNDHVAWSRTDLKAD